MQVETWPVSRLNPYEGNARVHPDWQVAQIAASITAADLAEFIGT